jgi:multicomponent Na+:H+ antiporter subunit F
MASFLIVVAGFVLALLALGLICVLRGPAAADRMMSAQLLGTSGIAALLLLSVAITYPAIVDVALALALLAAFASIAFVTSSSRSDSHERDTADGNERRA